MHKVVHIIQRTPVLLLGQAEKKEKLSSRTYSSDVSWYVSQNIVQHEIRRDSFRLRLEIQYQTMAQGSGGKSGDIIETYVESTLRQSPNLGAKQQGLCAPGAAAKPEELVCDVQSRLRAGVGCHDKAHGVILYMGGDRNLLNQMLHFYERGAINDLFDFSTVSFSSARHHLGKLIGTRIFHK